MRKVEMINRMIIFGYIKEEDTNYYLTKNEQDLLKLYLMVVSTRLEQIGEKDEQK